MPSPQKTHALSSNVHRTYYKIAVEDDYVGGEGGAWTCDAASAVSGRAFQAGTKLAGSMEWLSANKAGKCSASLK